MDKNNNLLWIDKYSPDKLDKFIGNTNLINKIGSHIQNIKANKADTNLIVITGPGSSGKTTLANLLMQEYNFEVKEFNTSEIKTAKQTREIIYKIITTHNISMMMSNSKQAGIIIDEIDAIASNEKTFISEISSMFTEKKIKKNSLKLRKDIPIIFICETINEKKISDIIKISEKYVLSKISSLEMFNYAKKILDIEKIDMEDSCLHLFIKHCQLDMRRMFTLLQFISSNEVQINDSNIEEQLHTLEKKIVNYSIFQIAEKLFYTNLSLDDKFSYIDSEKVTIPLICHENFINFIDMKKMSIKDKMYEVIKCSDNLSKHDVTEHTIYENQSWDLYNFLTPLVLDTVNRININTTNKRDIIYTSLVNKIGVYFNHKKIYGYLKNKLELDDYTDVFYLSEIVLNIFLTKTMPEKKTLIDTIIKKYSINIDDIEKFLRINKSLDFKKGYTNKMKKSFNNVYN